ncbi:scinderin like a [Periophthalmus magnuspinnatus]|uniref:scinderin like a n=1 Tax=Periophthalmus magnuspinnatus TaxID=409849 RepID=UPI002436374C|nr:scinderin like a [Periophthalmus magnuspinnatus]
MADRVFKGAGEKPGLQVWRVEKMSLTPVSKAHHGNFFTGDAYIVLHTTSAPSYNVHSWAGSEASQDERGAAAILMMQLDDYLKGRPRQFTEFQNEESITFTTYFKSGITYKQGGVASGFKHVDTNKENIKRLIHVKGRIIVRGTEVPLTWESFNSGDCFIIDLGENIYHWSGRESNRFERLKTTVLAMDIRDSERKGRAEVHMIEEDKEPDEVISVLGPKPDLPPGSQDSDVCVSKKAKSEASLYMISNAAGSMKATRVAEKNPFKQDMLSPNECYILDNGGNRKIFVWKGPKANSEERKAAMLAAQQFIKDHNYPSNTQIQIMPAGAETTLFKDFFYNWLDKDETVGLGQAYAIGKIAQIQKVPFDASGLHNNKAMAAQHGMVDDGSGNVQIWRVEGGDKVPVDAETYGQFYGGDCYLVLYSYNCGGRTKHIIYTWQGKKCSKDELGASAILTVALDDSMGGVATQVRVTQGKEPAHLVSLFKGNPMVVYLGGTSRSGGQTAAGKVRLFHIRLNSTKATRAVEVEPTASSLNTNDVFVLKTPDAVYLWRGVGAAEEEMVAANYMASLLGGTATEVVEKREPDSFWAALGGKKEYQTSKTLQNAMRPPRLFVCSNKTGRLIAEEMPRDFSQVDLATDDIMILDAWDQIYVWVGKDANEEEKQGVGNIAQDYINTDPAGRRGTPMVIFKQGEEPLSFIGWFHGWDDDMWDKDPMEIINMFKCH